MRSFFILISFLFSLACHQPAFAGGYAVFGTHTAASCTNTSTSMISADDKRNYILFVNLGSATVFLKAGSTISASEGIPVPAGGSYEPIKAFKDAVYCKSATGTQSLLIVTGQ